MPELVPVMVRWSIVTLSAPAISKTYLLDPVSLRLKTADESLGPWMVTPLNTPEIRTFCSRLYVP